LRDWAPFYFLKRCNSSIVYQCPKCCKEKQMANLIINYTTWVKILSTGRKTNNSKAFHLYKMITSYPYPNIFPLIAHQWKGWFWNCFIYDKKFY
jgi:hypothetical protein